LGAKKLHTYVFLDTGLGICNKILKKNVGDAVEKYVFFWKKICEILKK